MPQPRRVLIADNDDSVVEVLRIFLERAGAEVAAARDGLLALELLAASPFDVLVCDLDMPRMGGEELLARLTGPAGPSPRPAVFVVSGYVDEVISARLRNLPPVEDVLRKPFDLRAFADRVMAFEPEPEQRLVAGEGA